MGHDDFAPTTAAIVGSFGKAANKHYPDYVRWCGFIGRDTDPNTLKTWRSYRTGTDLGWSALCSFAGYTPPGMFATPPPAGSMSAPNPAVVARQEMFSKYVRCGAIDKFFDIKTGEMLSPKEFCARNKNIAPFGSRGENTAEAIFINRGTEENTVYAPTYRPDCGPGIVRELRDGAMHNCINVYRPSIIKPKIGATAADAAPWLELAEGLFGKEGKKGSGFGQIMDWAAYLLQHPGKKINWAPVLYSEIHGVGKDLFLEVFTHILGRHNCRIVLPDTLLGSFTEFLEGQLIIVPEMKNFERGKVANKLKSWLTTPPATVEVRHKFQRPYEIPNIQAWAFTTNHDDAVCVEARDRRYWIWDCGRSAILDPNKGRWMSEEWYRQGGAEVVAGYLLTRGISHFNPGEAPPMTEIKQTMIRNSEPRIVRFLREQFEEGAQLEGRTVLVAEDVIEAAGKTTCIKLGVSTRKHVPAALKSEGFVQGLRLRLEDTRSALPKQLWLKDASGLLSQMGGAALRKKYAEERATAQNKRAHDAGSAFDEDDGGEAARDGGEEGCGGW